MFATGYYWRFSRVWTDDALIYFRIADHLRQGLGPVLNAGDLHGAGTSLVWVYLLAGWAELFGSDDLVSVAKLLSTVLTFAASILFCFSFRRSLGLLSLIVPVALISIPLFLLFAGLETPLAIAAIALAHWCYFCRNSLPLSAAALALSFFCRGDAILLGAPIGLDFLLRMHREGWPRELFISARKAAIVFVACFSLGIAINSMVTGHPLPSTLLVKILQGRGRWPTYAEGFWHYLLLALNNNWWMLGFTVVGLRVSGSAGIALVATAGLHGLAYAILSVADYPWYSWQLMLSVRLVTCFGAAVALLGGVALLYRQLGRRLPGLQALPARVLSGLLFLPCLAAIGWWTISFVPASIFEHHSAMGGAGFVTTYYDVAQYLLDDQRERNHTGKRPTILAEEIGILGYYCPEFEIRDIHGLTVTGITQENMSQWNFWIKRFEPEYLVMRGEHPATLSYPSEDGESEYRYRRVMIIRAPDFVPITVQRREP
jgi:hypothetical protein